MLDSGCSLHVDLRLIYDSVVIGVFSDTADPISAHGTPGSIQIVHVHLAVRNLDGLIKINPSDPIPKWRSLTIFAVPQGSSTVSSKQFT